VLEESESEFNSMCEITTKLVINKNNYLTETDLGGVILTSFTGRIVCDNTLKARLNYCVQLLLPDIRKILFQVSDNELGKARK
jgi:vacuolar-type H+-ATPase subunit E/Vma4